MRLVAETASLAKNGGNNRRAAKIPDLTYRWWRKLESALIENRKSNTPSSTASCQLYERRNSYYE